MARAAITVHLPAQPSNHQVATAFALEALPFDNAFSPALVRDSGAEVRTYVRSALANPRPEELKIITRRAADGATETVVAPDVWRPLCPAC